jgi:hypothetical protein
VRLHVTLPKIGVRQVEIGVVPHDRVERVVGLDARFHVRGRPEREDLRERHVGEECRPAVQAFVERRIAARRERVLHAEQARIEPSIPRRIIQRRIAVHHEIA